MHKSRLIFGKVRLLEAKFEQSKFNENQQQSLYYSKLHQLLLNIKTTELQTEILPILRLWMSECRICQDWGLKVF